MGSPVHLEKPHIPTKLFRANTSRKQKGIWYCLTQQPALRQMAGHTAVRIIGFILPILEKKEKIRKQVPSDILKSTWAGISSS